MIRNSLANAATAALAICGSKRDLQKISLRISRDIVRLATANGLDVLDHTEYKNLKRFFDNLAIEPDEI